MSYLNNKENKFLSTKLTDKGREKIAKGKLTFSKWSAGDSEINYPYEEVRYSSGDVLKTKILKPKAKQPNLKYILSEKTALDVTRFDIGYDDLVLTKLDAIEKAKTRGFFMVDESTNELKIDTSKIKGKTKINLNTINENVFVLESANSIGVDASDILLVEIPEPNMVTSNVISNTLGYSTYKTLRILNIAEDEVAGSIKLPKHTNVSEYIVYVIDGRVVNEVPAWNSYPEIVWNTNGMLSYDIQNTEFVGDTSIWDFNIINLESIVGHDTYNANTLGREIIGLVEMYLGYNETLNYNLTTPDKCDNQYSGTIRDPKIKQIGVGHFSNRDYGNVYADYFVIEHNNDNTIDGLHSDNQHTPISRPSKYFVVTLPTVSYYYGSKSDAKIGARLISTGAVKTIPDSDISYYDLKVEGTDLVVGKVFHELKLFVIDDSEFLMCVASSSGRNFMLKGLDARLEYSLDGILKPGYDMFITYGINTDHMLHSMDYVVVSNNTEAPKDIEISFNTEASKFMFNPSTPSYGGYSVESLKVYFQIVASGERPKYDSWKEFEAGSAFKTNYEMKPYIDPNKLTYEKIKLTTENSNRDAVNNIYTDLTQSLGSETIMLGNVDCYIGTSIYKTILRVDINSNKFNITTNPTHKTEPLRISEVGVFDEDGDLVLVGKLSEPIRLDKRIIITLELTIDF